MVDTMPKTRPRHPPTSSRTPSSPKRLLSARRVRGCLRGRRARPRRRHRRAGLPHPQPASCSTCGAGVYRVTDAPFDPWLLPSKLQPAGRFSPTTEPRPSTASRRSSTPCAFSRPARCPASPSVRSSIAASETLQSATRPNNFVGGILSSPPRPPRRRRHVARAHARRLLRAHRPRPSPRTALHPLPRSAPAPSSTSTSSSTSPSAAPAASAARASACSSRRTPSTATPASTSPTSTGAFLPVEPTHLTRDREFGGFYFRRWRLVAMRPFRRCLSNE